MKNISKKVFSFVKEIVIVIIGILIAMSINNWNENRKNQKFTEKALYAIEREIEINKRDLTEISKRHYMTVDTILTYLENDNISISQVIRRVKGFQIPEVKNIGLRFFIANKAELIEYEIISNLSEIELLSEALKIKTQKLIDFLYDNMDSTEKVDKNKFIVFLKEVIETETGLIELYDTYFGKEE